MTEALVLMTVTDGVAVVTLNRPDKRNAMSDAMRAAFAEVLQAVAADASVRAVVLTGAGRGFCAGGDVAGMQQRMAAPPGEVAFNGWSRQQGVHRVQMLLHTLPKPVIAAVNGAAAGLGADTALACDFVLASESASFAWSYVLRGLIPDGGGLYFLPRRVGLAMAKELIFTGRTVAAAEAKALGLADRVSPAASLLDDAIAWAKTLSAGSATAIALAKGLVNQAFETAPVALFASSSQAQGICYTSAEHRHSVEAFLAKSAAK